MLEDSEVNHKKETKKHRRYYGRNIILALSEKKIRRLQPSDSKNALNSGREWYKNVYFQINAQLLVYLYTIIFIFIITILTFFV
jgi:hypothetical protein